MKPNKRCKHYWYYLHSLWQANDNDGRTVAVGRYCYNCGKTQTATANNWRPLPKSYDGIREAMESEMNLS